MAEINVRDSSGETLTINYEAKPGSPLENYAEHLGGSSMKEEARAYCGEAKSSSDKKTRLGDKYNNKFTLVYNGNKKYTLRNSGE